jgi:site-specific DNA-methyltransferase (adenine-specific)
MSKQPGKTQRSRSSKRTGRGTQTSAFGSPGRSNHNAAAFYGGKLYEGLPREEKVPEIENPVPPEHLDQIFCHSAEKMAELPDACVHLMITSPPYNVGKEYDDDFTLGEYLGFLRGVWQEVYRVLVPGGRACINIANLGRKPYIPLNAFIAREMIELGFLMRGEIIWNKAGSASPSTAWGSWMSASNPTLRDIHEYILVFSKQRFGRRKKPLQQQGGDGSPLLERTSTISRDEFLEYTKSVWTFPPEPARHIGHPAPFPVELPYRLIQLFTFADEVILDPFMGSGQTAIAAQKSGRHYVGYEISSDYVELARQRISAAADSG